MQFDVSFLIRIFPSIFQYVYLTIWISVLATAFGLALGFPLALISNRKTAVLYPLTQLYISYFRGTPLLVQLFILYYGLPEVFPPLASMGPITATVIGLSLKNSAYFSESIRAAFNSVDEGQLEASMSLGMTKWQGIRRIVLPQAFRIALPSFSNIYLILVKDTSLSFTLGVTDMLSHAKSIAAGSMRYLESFIAVGVCYWIISVLISFAQGKLETRLNRPYSKERNAL